MDVVSRIHRFNAGRDPDLLLRKYARIASDPFLFLRGTCHLFYEDWPGGRKLDAAPASWISGDLHLENVGAYKGDNRLAYFDLNDFDEAALAPCTWEIARFLVSLHVAARSLRIRLSDARVLCREFIDAYASALADGKPRWIERDLARGVIRTLLERVVRRGRREFLDRRTLQEGKHRRFLIDNERLLGVPAIEREKLIKWFEQFAASQVTAKFFRPIDIARRVAGTGSVGLRRYAVLIRGRGSPNANIMLDMKLAQPSAPAERLDSMPQVCKQPKWTSEACRIVTIQQRMQAIAPAFLMAVRFDRQDFVLKELQPSEDRLDLAAVRGNVAILSEAIRTMGKLVAWSQLRASGRQGAASADDLMAFAATNQWRKPLVEIVEESAARTVQDWSEFRTAWQQDTEGAGAAGDKKKTAADTKPTRRRRDG